MDRSCTSVGAQAFVFLILKGNRIAKNLLPPLEPKLLVMWAKKLLNRRKWCTAPANSQKHGISIYRSGAIYVVFSASWIFSCLKKVTNWRYRPYREVLHTV